MPSPRRTITCVSCCRRAKNWSRGRCAACAKAAAYAAANSRGQAGPHGRGVPKGAVVVSGRIEDYAELTREQYYTLENAAARMGISVRTAQRYEARVREMEAVLNDAA
jgi:hypothetical protein